jgi:hypothetical protein
VRGFAKCFYRLRISDKHLFFCYGPSSSWTSFSALTSTASTSVVQYLSCQLDLFASLCRDRNYDVITFLTANFLSSADTFMLMQDDKLPHLLRGKLVKYFLHSAVNVGDNVNVLSQTPLSFAWTRLSKEPYGDAIKDKSLALCGGRLAWFEALCAWILSEVRQAFSLDLSSTEYNSFLVEVLTLCHQLTLFGYYAAPDDISNLVPALVHLLDGLDDVPTRAHGVNQSSEFLGIWRANDR